MKKFVCKILALVIPVGILIWSINVLVDPANLFWGESNIREVCEHLNKNEIVAGNLNMSERDLQREFIRTQETVPEAIIIQKTGKMVICLIQSS